VRPEASDGLSRGYMVPASYSITDTRLSLTYRSFGRCLLVRSDRLFSRWVFRWVFLQTINFSFSFHLLINLGISKSKFYNLNYKAFSYHQYTFGTNISLIWLYCRGAFLSTNEDLNIFAIAQLDTSNILKLFTR
jgi:hypothetical protein